MAPILRMKGITKRFPGVVANDHVDLEVEEGEIHALLGENGAGKTTLMNILYGLYQPQEGEIYLAGRHVRISSAHEAISLGIGMVHQHFMLIPVFTVTENIILGLKSSRGIVLDRAQAEQRIRELSNQYGLDVDPQAYVWQLSVGLQQRVEIIKTLYRGARLLILDEPTAVLTPQEARELFAILRALARQGTSIIFISHKLNEVMAISDRVTVLRDGHVVDTVPTAGTSPPELARMMVGREVILQIDRPFIERGEPALIVQDLHALNDKGLPALAGLSFEVHRGEILGLAGVDGNGQSELAEVLVGLRRATAGRVLVKGQDLCNRPPAAFLDAGVACIPQDRKRTGSIAQFSVAENTILGSHEDPPFARRGVLAWGAVTGYANRLIEDFDVRPPRADLKARSLSGGNLQKLILAREVSRGHDILVAAQPTRGLDVGAIEFVYRRLLAERERGTAILLISTELDEVLSLSDRIAVIYEGQIAGVMASKEVDVEEIGLLMAGVTHDFAPGERPRRGAEVSQTRP